MTPLARIIAVMTRAGDALYPNSPMRVENISERERLRNRANAVIRRDRVTHQRLQTQAFNQESRTL
jgi:hypothetical protein